MKPNKLYRGYAITIPGRCELTQWFIIALIIKRKLKKETKYPKHCTIHKAKIGIEDGRQYWIPRSTKIYKKEQADARG